MKRIAVSTTILALACLHAFGDAGPAVHRWVSADGSMTSARASACSVALADGRVLITGGDGPAGPLTSTEFYDVDGRFKHAASMLDAHSAHGCALLPDGRVL